MKEEISVFIRKAKIFERDAKYDFENGDYDIAMFHLEQAAQLLIKAKLLDLTGSYDRTHSLRRLLTKLSKVYRENTIKDFIVKNRKTLRDLERAYISSRYYYEEFFKDEVFKAFEVVKELRNILWRE